MTACLPRFLSPVYIKRNDQKLEHRHQAIKYDDLVQIELEKQQPSE